MTNIQPNARGKVNRAQKKLNGYLQELKNADSLSAGQRDALFVKVQIALIRIQLLKFNRLGDDD